MAEQIDPPGADGIEITVPVEIFESHSLATANRHQRQPFVIFHLGAGMPQITKILCRQFAVIQFVKPL